MREKILFGKDAQRLTTARKGVVKGLVLVFLTSLRLVGCSAPTPLPAIDDPAQLRAECAALSKSETADALEKGAWPPAIKKLNPIIVSREKKAIYITIFAETGVEARGYVVTQEKPASNEGYKISKTSFPGIYRFDFVP